MSTVYMYSFLSFFFSFSSFSIFSLLFTIRLIILSSINYAGDVFCDINWFKGEKRDPFVMTCLQFSKTQSKDQSCIYTCGLLVSLHVYAWARAKHFGCHSVCLSVIMGIHFQIFKLEHRVLYSH